MPFPDLVASPTVRILAHLVAMPERNDISPVTATAPVPAPVAPLPALSPVPAAPVAVREIGGVSGPEPTRYGDWERAGRCIDF
jgi:hypothetical protein